MQMKWCSICAPCCYCSVMCAASLHPPPDDAPLPTGTIMRALLLLWHVRRPLAPLTRRCTAPECTTIVEGLRVLLQVERLFGTQQQTLPPAGSSVTMHRRRPRRGCRIGCGR
ncbi:hypothetical protein EI94DRAFT_712003 [Lactarius quietus]|nr:hypothetical protein EI94DRAFT_712003 [Lactarius quietus]